MLSTEKESCRLPLWFFGPEEGRYVETVNAWVYIQGGYLCFVKAQLSSSVLTHLGVAPSAVLADPTYVVPAIMDAPLLTGHQPTSEHSLICYDRSDSSNPIPTKLGDGPMQTS